MWIYLFCFEIKIVTHVNGLAVAHGEREHLQTSKARTTFGAAAPV